MPWRISASQMPTCVCHDIGAHVTQAAVQDSTKVLLALLMPMSILEPIVADHSQEQPPAGGAASLPAPAGVFCCLRRCHEPTCGLHA